MLPKCQDEFNTINNRLVKFKLQLLSMSQLKEKKTCGRWTSEQHHRFIQAYKLYGKNWKNVQDYVGNFGSAGTRTSAQIRSHAQKFFSKIERTDKMVEESLSEQKESKSIEDTFCYRKQLAQITNEDSSYFCNFIMKNYKQKNKYPNIFDHLEIASQVQQNKNIGYTFRPYKGS